MLKKSIILCFIGVFTCFAQIKDNTNNLYILAQSYMRGAQYKNAKDIFEKIYKQSPNNYQYFHSLNQAYLQLKMYKESLDLINKKIKRSPNDINLYGLLGSTYYLSGDEQKAFAIWDESLKRVKPTYINYRVLANQAIERRAFEKAIEYLQKGKNLSNDPKFFSYDLGNLYSLTMQFENATKEYCSILANDPKQLNAVQSRILKYVTKPNALDITLNVIINWKDKKNIGFSFLLARLFRESGQDEKAFEEYLKIEEKQNSNGRQLIAFANSLLSQNKFSLASRVFKKIIKDNVNSPIISSAKLGYTKSFGAELKEKIKASSPVWKPYYFSKDLYPKQTNEVISAYKQLVKEYSLSEVGAEAYYRIGEINFTIENNPEKTVSDLTTLINNYPTSKFIADAFEMRGLAYLYNSKLNKAYSDFTLMTRDRRISSQKKNSALYNLAKINFYRGKFDEAAALLNSLIQNKNDKSSNNALELSLLINTTKNDSTHLAKFAKADLFIFQDKFDSAYYLLKNIFTDKSSFFVLKSYAKFKFAQVEIALDSLKSSIITLSEIGKESKRNIFADKALFLKGKVYQFGLKRIKDAINMYQKLLEKFPNSIFIDEVRQEIIKLNKKK